jgi:hypothetical protein
MRFIWSNRYIYFNMGEVTFRRPTQLCYSAHDYVYNSLRSQMLVRTCDILTLVTFYHTSNIICFSKYDWKLPSEKSLIAGAWSLQTTECQVNRDEDKRLPPLLFKYLSFLTLLSSSLSVLLILHSFILSFFPSFNSYLFFFSSFVFHSSVLASNELFCS